MQRAASELPHSVSEPAYNDERDMPTNYRNRITMEPGKRGGKPAVRGLRITVYDVLGWLSEGMTQSEILEDFPELEAEDIAACLAFAANREHDLASLKT